MNDRQRLEAIIAVVCKYLPPDGISIEKAMNEIISLVDPLPAQHIEQEPVAWQGLTDEKMEATFIECGGKWNGDFWKIEDADFHPFLRTIEAKLKELNK